MFNQFRNIGSSERDCNNSTLHYDEACLKVVTDKEITFWSQYEECQGCRLLETTSVYREQEIKIKTFSALRYSIRDLNGQICNGIYKLIKHFHSIFFVSFAWSINKHMCCNPYQPPTEYHPFYVV